MNTQLNSIKKNNNKKSSTFKFAAAVCLGLTIAFATTADAKAGDVSTAEWYESLQNADYNSNYNSRHNYDRPLNYDHRSNNNNYDYNSRHNNDYSNSNSYRNNYRPLSYESYDPDSSSRYRHRTRRPVSRDDYSRDLDYRQDLDYGRELDYRQPNLNDFSRDRSNYDYNSRHGNDRYRNDRHQSPNYDHGLDNSRFPNSDYDLYRDRAPQNNSPRYPDIRQYPDLNDSSTRREPTELEKIRARVASRYGNPVVGRFLQSMSTEQVIRVFQEVSQMIDQRHLEPKSYQDRTEQAIKNLMVAVASPAFQRANNINPSPQQVESFQRELNQMAAGNSVKSANEAVQFMYTTMNAGQSRLGLRPSAVALEFVYASAESLDKYSAFTPDDQARRPSASLEDHLVGIGVEIKPHDDGVRVVRPLRGGPAAEAGLKNNDIIVGINGKSLRGQTIDYAADLISGQAGSQLRIDVIRNGRNLQPITMVRRRVNVYSVSEVHMLDERVGYIRLDKFAESSTEEVDRALWELYRKGMKSLVFDVRGNPGGLLTTAVSLSDKFLPCGNIVSTRGRNTVDQSSETASYEQTWRVPMVVLVDGNSASASEIFAAAIQENQRGLVVGRTSYGKGTVQTHFPLRSISGNLKLTTAKFYSPNGRQMAGAGVTPDINVGGSNDELEGFSTSDRDIQAAHRAVETRQVYEMAKNESCRNNNSLSGN